MFHRRSALRLVVLFAAVALLVSCKPAAKPVAPAPSAKSVAFDSNRERFDAAARFVLDRTRWLSRTWAQIELPASYADLAQDGRAQYFSADARDFVFFPQVRESSGVSDGYLYSGDKRRPAPLLLESGAAGEPVAAGWSRTSVLEPAKQR